MKSVYLARGSRDRGGGEVGKNKHGGLPLTRDPKEYSEVMRKEPTTGNPLAAFVVRPKKVQFETQDPDEKILLLLRKHIVTNLGWVVVTLVFLLLPLVLLDIEPISSLPVNFLVVTSLVWYLLVLGYAFEKFLAWYFNVYIITDERIIDYDFYSLVYKRVSEAKLDRIEDVTFTLGGVLMSLFHYGDVFVQTAGEQREIDFHAVPKPEVVVKLLNELILEEEREKHEGRVR